MSNVLDLWVGLTTVHSTALGNSLVAITPSTYGSAGPFIMPTCTVFNFDTGTGYMILVFDATAVPANGTVNPIYAAFLGVATATVPTFVAISWPNAAIRATNGIVIAGSTTLTTDKSLALATASKLSFYAQVQG